MRHPSILTGAIDKEDFVLVVAAPGGRIGGLRQALVIGLSGEIHVRPENREQFLGELQTMLQDLFTRYGGAEGDAFKLAVACYPKQADDSSEGGDHD
ncbi:hypothetical protein ACQEVF_28440 [Nonomuraea polychroma]|uniref:hypothetical protein n=1 Tax=Nonomuraea polychroma TaxID=46176 RepID=UPI003D8D54F6